MYQLMVVPRKRGRVWSSKAAARLQIKTTCYSRVISDNLFGILWTYIGVHICLVQSLIYFVDLIFVCFYFVYLYINICTTGFWDFLALVNKYHHTLKSVTG